MRCDASPATQLRLCFYRVLTVRTPYSPAMVVNYNRCHDLTCCFYYVNGGERGIRTLEGLLTLTPLAGVRLRPLGHLSGDVLKANAINTLHLPGRFRSGRHDTGEEYLR
jgi:hypothetical protein